METTQQKNNFLSKLDNPNFNNLYFSPFATFYMAQLLTNAKYVN